MKKGFTLIELLAVIIILAIIALITTPIILNVMDDARKSAGLSETYIIYDGINNYCRTSEIKKETGTLTTDDIDCSTKTTFTNEEINKMINLGNAEVLENTFGPRKLTWLKVKSNGYIYIIDSSGNVEAIKEDEPEPIPPIDDTPITDTVVPDIVCDGENSCSGSVVDVVLVPDPDPGTDESDEINYEITIYTVGYITEGHVNSGIKGTTYTINMDNIPLDLNEYTLELVSSSVMTTQEDFNNYKQLKESGRPAMDMEGANADNSAVATVQELYEHSLNENQLVIDGIRVSCDTTKCQATISESFQNLTNLNYHETTTAKGDTLKVVYNGIKFVLRKKEKTNEPILLTNKILEDNIVRSDKDIDFTKKNIYGTDFVEYVDTTETTYNFDTNRSYWFGNNYTFDTSTGQYTITGEDSSRTSWSTSAKDSYKYFCATTKQTVNCDEMYEISPNSTATNSSVTGYAHKSVANNYVDNGNGLFYPDGEENVTYYFRGDVDNYVNFAGFIWRIIRINEDSSIRLILAENIGESVYNSLGGDNAYLGYMTGTAKATTYEDSHSNMNDSTIKTFLDTWYEENLLDYSSYISDSGFCSDLSLYDQNGYEPFDSSNSEFSSSGIQVTDTGLGYGTNPTFYGGFYRAYYGEPSFKCINNNDLYSVDSSNGNGLLKYPIGLITSDESIYGGASFDSINENYYLYFELKPWWTMTPSMYVSYYGENRTSNLSGVDGLYYTDITDERYVRPVINLSSDIKCISGDGTYTNPYEIEYNH